MSFYTSLNGLKNAQSELSVIANNLANAETTGFKKSRINFADIVASSASANPKLVKGIGSAVQSIDQNFSLGPTIALSAARWSAMFSIAVWRFFAAFSSILAFLSALSAYLPP